MFLKKLVVKMKVHPFFVLLKLKGITLIEVPYWWDKNRESLEATIYEQRPELLDRNPVTNSIPTIKPIK